MNDKEKEEEEKEIRKIKPPSSGRSEMDIDETWLNLFVIIYIILLVTIFLITCIGIARNCH